MIITSKKNKAWQLAIYCSFQFILSGVHPIRFDSSVFCIIYAMPHQPVYQNPRSILFPIIIASNPIWTSPQSLFLVNKILCQITLFSISCIIMNRAVHIRAVESEFKSNPIFLILSDFIRFFIRFLSDFYTFPDF